MNRRLVTGLSLVGLAVALMWGGGPLRNTESQAASISVRFRDKSVEQRVDSLLRSQGLRPDLTSKNWKPLSRDVGIMVLDDPYYGRHARLFVREDGWWHPVGVDGPEDIAGIVAAR